MNVNRYTLVGQFLAVIGLVLLVWVFAARA